MCDFQIDAAEIIQNYDITRSELKAMFDVADRDFAGLLTISEEGLFIPPEARPLTRIIARAFDAYDLSKAGHSSAI